MVSGPRREARAVLLTRQDWVYLLSLLVPFVVYNLGLKAASMLSVPGLALTLNLILSDIFFNLGYALFWIGIFAAARRGLMRWTVIFLFHGSSRASGSAGTVGWSSARRPGCSVFAASVFATSGGQTYSKGCSTWPARLSASASSPTNLLTGTHPVPARRVKLGRVRRVRGRTGRRSVARARSRCARCRWSARARPVG
jgi:hypothetical protein